MHAFIDETSDTRVVFAARAEARVGRELIALGAERVLLVATARHREGADRIARQLGDRCVGVFDGAEPHVPEAVADALAERVRELDADWVVAHGGGTAIGAAKAAALRVEVAVGAVPTTYSGSERTAIWGVSAAGVKQTGRDPRVRPRLVVYDPELLAPLRLEVVRSSLFNALAHAVETLYAPEASDELLDRAEAAAAALVTGLEALHAHPGAPEAVDVALYGACLAGACLDGATMALHHKLAHTLGGSFGLPHAETHAVLLPHTAAFNLTPEATRRLRRALGVADPAAHLFDLAVATGIPTRLSGLGFTRAEVPRATELALARPYPNPRPLTSDGIARLLTDAVLGRRPSRDRRRLPLDGVHGPHAGLDAAVFGPALHRARGVVIAVHGRGDTAESMAARVLPLLPPGTALIAPQADQDSWYPKGYRDLEANREGLASALSALDRAWELATAHVAAAKVVVVGWSQGACLALSWLARAPGRPGGLVAWTGAAIPGYDRYVGLERTRIAVCTATRDPWVELDAVRSTVEALRAGGAGPLLLETPTATHGIRPADRDALVGILESQVNGDELEYQHGFGSALASEAVPGALHRRQNTPLDPPFGLYAEQINGTGFTLKRALNHRVWLYRLRPQIPTVPWERIDAGHYAGTFEEGVPTPQILRYRPRPWPTVATDFVQGLVTFAGAGDPCTRTGMAIHWYAATAEMTDKVFSNADGDLLVVPQEGALRIRSELGWLHVRPGQIAILPRGIRYQILLPEGRSRGFVSELFNGHHQLPERGPIGANGLADERHFKAPVASFEDREAPFEHVHKHGGALWRTELTHSPFDVVAWHGTYAPFAFDLLDFTAYWSASVDHADPSVLTVLTCPHDDHGRNALDFAVFRGRWDPTEHTFRPPFLHRNSAVEFNAVILTEATTGPWQGGACSFTPYLSPHGVAASTYAREYARRAVGDDSPRRIPDEEMWIQWESTYPMRVMPWALDDEARDADYLAQFAGYPQVRLP